MPESSRNSLPSIRLEFRPSRWLARYLVCFAIALSFAIFNNGLSGYIQVASFLFVATFLVLKFRQARYPGGLSGLLMDHHGQWTLLGLQGGADKAYLSSHSRLMPFAVSLQFQLVGGRSRSVLVCRDCVSDSEFRSLRRLLRVHSSALFALRE